MDYEGPEKKLELTCTGSVNFLSYSDEYWKDLLEACGAYVLNQVSTDSVKAFLISESSLFVWKHRVLMITCGQTELIHSAKLLIEKVGTENISSLYFSRKNEHYPDRQKSFPKADFKQLKKVLSGGQAYRLGVRDMHHLYVFEYVAPDANLIKENISEVLIYRMNEQATQAFLQNKPEQRAWVEAAVAKIFPDYQLDHHWFEPCGYSVNAFKDEKYGTVHVTPEPDQSYISFETNGVSRQELLAWAEKICGVFGPEALDIIFYDNIQSEPLQVALSKYNLLQKTYQALDSGLALNHLHFSLLNAKTWSEAVSLNID